MTCEKKYYHIIGSGVSGSEKQKGYFLVVSKWQRTNEHNPTGIWLDFVQKFQKKHTLDRPADFYTVH